MAHTLATARNKTGAAFWDQVRIRFLHVPPDRGSSDEPPRRQGLAIALSVFISCMLWFTFTMQEEYVRVIQMPTEVSDLPTDLALAELPPQRVRVEVVGPGWQLFLFGLGSDVPVIPIDASQREVNLETAVTSMSWPNDVQVRNVSPARITLPTEERIVKRVPVQLNVRIDTPSDHDFVDPPRVMPDSVTVAGANSVIGDLESWPTVYYENLNLRDTLRTSIALADTLEGLITKSPDTVILQAVAEPFTQETREIGVSVRGIPSPDNVVKLEPATIRVRYRVPLSQYDAALNAPGFFAEVSYDQILEDTTGRIRPDLNVPEHLDIRDVELFPSTIQAYQVIEQ